MTGGQGGPSRDVGPTPSLPESYNVAGPDRATYPGMVAGALLALALGGCGSRDGALPRVGARTVITPNRGFRVSAPELRQAPSGLRVWTRVCRNAFATNTPRGVRFELADTQERVVSAAFAPLSPPLRNTGRYGFLRLQSDWRLSASQHLHLCVVPYFGKQDVPCFERSSHGEQ